MENSKPTNRRALLKAATGALLAGALPRTLLARRPRAPLRPAPGRLEELRSRHAREPAARQRPVDGLDSPALGRHRLAAHAVEQLVRQRQEHACRQRPALRRALPDGRVRRQRAADAGSGLARPDPRPRRELEEAVRRRRVAGRPAPVAAADRPAAAGRHRQEDRAADHLGRAHRRRQGPAHLRLDRAEHLPRAEGERLRHRRHQDHAGDR
jgi:hypothetical protein